MKRLRKTVKTKRKEFVLQVRPSPSSYEFVLLGQLRQALQQEVQAFASRGSSCVVFVRGWPKEDVEAAPGGLEN